MKNSNKPKSETKELFFDLTLSEDVALGDLLNEYTQEETFDQTAPTSDSGVQAPVSLTKEQGQISSISAVDIDLRHKLPNDNMIKQTKLQQTGAFLFDIEHLESIDSDTSEISVTKSSTIPADRPNAAIAQNNNASSVFVDPVLSVTPAPEPKAEEPAVTLGISLDQLVETIDTLATTPNVTRSAKRNHLLTQEPVQAPEIQPKMSEQVSDLDDLLHRLDALAENDVFLALQKEKRSTKEPGVIGEHVDTVVPPTMFEPRPVVEQQQDELEMSPILSEMNQLSAEQLTPQPPTSAPDVPTNEATAPLDVTILQLLDSLDDTVLSINDTVVPTLMAESSSDIVSDQVSHTNEGITHLDQDLAPSSEIPTLLFSSSDELNHPGQKTQSADELEQTIIMQQNELTPKSTIDPKVLDQTKEYTDLLQTVDTSSSQTERLSLSLMIRSAIGILLYSSFFFFNTIFSATWLQIAGFVYRSLNFNSWFSILSQGSEDTLTLYRRMYLNNFIYILLVVLIVPLFWPEIKKGFKNLKNQVVFVTMIPFIYAITAISTLAVTSLLSVFITLPDTSKNQESLNAMSEISPFANLFPTLIGAPIVEELIFRLVIAGGVYTILHYLFLRTNRSRVLNVIVIVVSSLASISTFGLLHVASAGDFLAITPYVVMGTAMTALYFVSKRNIIVVMLFHTFVNLIATLGGLMR